MPKPKSEVQQQIDTAREILKPSPVRPNHIPRWFAQCLKPFRHKHDGTNMSFHRMREAVGGRWVDHYGSTLIVRREFGREVRTEQICFVSEPYGFRPDDARYLDELAKRTGVLWSLEANSWWYPGHTVRIVIEPPKATGA